MEGKDEKTVKIDTPFQKWKKRVADEVRLRIGQEGARNIAAKFFIAPILLFAAVSILFILLDFSTFGILTSFMLLYLFAPLGKESLIPAAITIGIAPLAIALALAFMDIIAALFLLWNYDFAKLFPLMGPWMMNSEKKGREILEKRRWLKGASFVGLIFFGIFPLRGTGGVGSTVLGRLIGLGPKAVFAAIFIRSILGALLLAYFFDYFKVVLGNDIFKIFSIVLIVFFLLWWSYDYYQTRQTV
ncbi:MAG: small multi-drug export protein [Thermoplasmata archaeon]